MVCIEELLKYAKENDASDVLITVGVAPKMRVSGKLISVGDTPCTPKDTREVLEQIMPEIGKEPFETKGSCDFSYSIPEQGRYRVNAYRQRGSVALAIRLVSWDIPKASDLGIPDAFLALAKEKRGLILVSGQNASGKSTSLACFLGHINETRNCHVITVEDPIEYLHQHKEAVINQREIGIDSISHGQAMRDVLRETCDVIMLDELNDCEDLSAALCAAETGRLVISAVCSRDVKSTLERMIGIFPVERQQQIASQLASSLLAIVSQQLVPGRDGNMVAAFEVLKVDEETEAQIRSRDFEGIVTRLSSGERTDSTSMEQALMRLFFDEQIDRDVAINYAYNRAEMETKL